MAVVSERDRHVRGVRFDDLHVQPLPVLVELPRVGEGTQPLAEQELDRVHVRAWFAESEPEDGGRCPEVAVEYQETDHLPVVAEHRSRVAVCSAKRRR